MVVGSGMMARAFSDYLNDCSVVIFASGVSNSFETNTAEFEREERLLRWARTEHKDKLLVYFGTCSVSDPERRESPYVTHKLRMEALLSQWGAPWVVFRIPLAIGSGHRGPTLAQYLYEKISAGEPFEVWSGATRYPIDVEDVRRVVTHFLSDRKMIGRIVNVALRSYSVLDFVRAMEAIVGKEAKFTLVPKGQSYAIACPEVASIAEELRLDQGYGYLENILRKYFAIRPSPVC